MFSLKRTNTVKSLHKGIIFLMLLFLFLANTSVLFAQTASSLPDVKTIFDPGKVGLSKIEGTSAAEKINFVAETVLLPLVKYLFISVSILCIVMYGVLLVTSTSEEEIGKQKENLIAAAKGFALLGIVTHIVAALNPYDSPGVGNVEAAVSATRSLILYIELIVGAIASLFIMIAAVRMIISQGDEEEMNKQKTNFTWGLIGLMIIMLAEAAVQIFYELPGEGTSAEATTALIVQVIGIVRFILQFLAVVSVLTLIIGGFYYISSFGNDDARSKAKNILLGAIVTIVLVISAYVFVQIFAPALTS